MSRFVPVAKAADVPPGTGRSIDVEGRRIALFNVDGRFYAMDGVCIHRGGPIGDGDLEGCVVACPWHGYEYDVTTGRLTLDPDVQLDTYEVRVTGDAVEIALG